MTPEVAAAIRTAVQQATSSLRAENARLKQSIEEAKQLILNRPKSISEEIDSIPGRRLVYSLVGIGTFTASQDGIRGNPIAMQISQDGPFIMTHYPMIMWRSSSPAGATDFGRWRPVTSWPLPDQVLDTNIVDISYELFDAGSQRNLQNLAVPGGLLSRPDNVIPLPVPTLFTSNTVVTLTPTFENILFEGSTPTTEGTLAVVLPGYRVANM